MFASAQSSFSLFTLILAYINNSTQNRAPEYSYNMNVDLSIFGSLLKLDPHRNGMAPDMDGDVRERFDQ